MQNHQDDGFFSVDQLLEECHALLDETSDLDDVAANMQHKKQQR